jgi:palmitoyltransferase
MLKEKMPNRFEANQITYVNLWQTESKQASTINMVKSDDLLHHAESPLCLCEYYNRRNQRVHILMCCCSCDALDAIVTNICCCRRDCNKDAHATLVDLLDDILDRIRIPYAGGAFKLNVDFVLSLVCLLSYLFIGKVNLLCTFAVLFIVPSVLYLRFFLARLKSKPIRLPFYTIANSFILILYLFFNIFQFELEPIIGSSQIGIYKILLVINIVGLYSVHTSNPGYSTTVVPIGSASQQYYCNKCQSYKPENVITSHCPLCAHCIYRRDHHCFWFDNCVGFSNHRQFFLYLVYLNFFFSYTFNLIITNIDGIYAIEHYSLLRLLFIQLITLNMYLIVLLGQQTLFICLNKTQYEIHKMYERERNFSLTKYFLKNFSVKYFLTNLCRFLFSCRSTPNSLNSFLV